MCQKDKLEFKIFQVLRANDLSLVQKPFFSSFSFLFHKSMKFTFRWGLNSNFITWCQNTTSTKETTIPTLPNPSNSHYARSFDSFHLMIVHMFVAAFCWSAPHINLAYSRRSHCGESLQGDVSRKNIRGWGRGWEQTRVTLTLPSSSTLSFSLLFSHSLASWHTPLSEYLEPDIS